MDPVRGETAPVDGAVPKILLPEAARSAPRDLREGLRYALSATSLLFNYHEFYFFSIRVSFIFEDLKLDCALEF